MKIKTAWACAVVALAMMTSSAFAQVAGRYTMTGKNPDGSSYAGAVQVEPTGDTFRVTWTIDGQRYVGTGIGSDEALAVTYRSGNNTGVALIFMDKGLYKVVWTYAGGTQLGLEEWRKR